MNFCNCPNCQTDNCPQAVEIAKLREALEGILERAKGHPLFCPQLFEERDIDGICAIGGDAADWTQNAIEADDALGGATGEKDAQE